MGANKPRGRFQGGVVVVVELTAAVLGQCAVGFTRLIGIAKMADHELVVMRSGCLIHGVQCDWHEHDCKKEVFHFFETTNRTDLHESMGLEFGF